MSYTQTTTTTQTTLDQIRSGTQVTLSGWNTLLTQVGEKIIDKTVIPYMRANKIVFTTNGLKPYTQIYTFFDNVPVTPYTINADIITFTSNTQFQDTYQHCETIYDNDGGTNGGLGANSATIILSKGNVAYVRDVMGVIVPGKTFVGTISGNVATIQSFQHKGGATDEIVGFRYQSAPFVQGTTPLANTTSIVLAGSANTTDNYYVGNTIYIASGDGIGVSSNITAYNGASRIATVTPAWNVSLTSPTNESFYYSIGKLTSDNNGDFCGIFMLPSTTNVAFPTGTSVFQVIDNTVANTSISTTKAQDSYTAKGILETEEQDFVSTRVPVYTTQSVQQTQTVLGDPVTTTTYNYSYNNTTSYNNNNSQGVYQNNTEDPLAQIINIDGSKFPNGVFTTSVKVCFFSKDNNLPVTVQLRPVVNGYPDSGTVLPFSQVTLLPYQINTTITPSLDDATQYTEFVFDTPVHLLADTSYAIVLLSNSNKYTLYTAMVGDKQLGSNRIISKPPYIGVFFKSQNSSTWTPFQGESLMFRVMQAQFTTGTPGYITFNSPAYNANSPFNTMAPNEYYMDLMYLTNQDQQFKDTTISYGFRATSNTTRSLDATYTNFTPSQNYSFTTREVIQPAGSSTYVQATITTNDTNISPLVDEERYGLISVANQINNGGISNNDITIVNPGQNYNISNTNIITVNGNGFGSGAVLQIGSLDANGNITSVIVTTGGNGTGYCNTISATITTSGYAPTTVATISVANETNPDSGNFITRYITRTVTLAPGMDAGDLSVRFSAYKPINTNIYVYYKILSAEDTTPFNARPWVLMSLNGTNAYSTAKNNLIDYNYVGSLDQYGNPIHKINYGSYTTFKYFAIKLVTASTDPTIIPYIEGLTVFAMPQAT